MRGLDDIHIFGFERVPRLVLGDQNFMQLLAGPYPDILDLATGRDSFRELCEIHAWNLRNKNLAAVHALEAVNNELYCALQDEPEAGHSWVSDGDLAPLTLLKKHGNHAATAAHDIAIASATETSILSAGIGIGLHKHFFRAQLCRAVEINGIYGLVCAQGQNAPNALVDGGINYIFPAHDVRLDRFERVVFAGGNLLEGSGMHNHGHAGQRALQPAQVTHITDEITQAGMIESRGPHVVLLEFVAAENDQPLGVILPQHHFDKLPAKRSRPAGDQDNLFRPVHLHAASLYRRDHPIFEA